MVTHGFRKVTCEFLVTGDQKVRSQWVMMLVPKVGRAGLWDPSFWWGMLYV